MGQARNGAATEESTVVSTETPAGASRGAGGVLLERERELEEVARAVAAARRGDGRVVVIEGAAGVGKSRLLGEAIAAADSEGLSGMVARGGELEREFAFGIVRQLLEPVLIRAGRADRERLLAGSARLAESVLAPVPRPVAEAADTAYPVLHGLYWLVSNLAERRPLLLAVDDLHWTDAPSLRFLDHLCRRLDGLAVAVLLAARSDEPGEHPQLQQALVLETRATVLRLRPLSEQAVARIVGARLGDATGPELVRACHQATGGNPFLLGEILHELGDHAAALDPEVVRRLGPGRVAAAILLRVGRLHSCAPALARAVTVLGEGANLRRAAAIADIDLAQAGAIADLLADARVLAAGDGLRFAHPVVRSAIYQEMPAAARAAMHARAARLLAGEGAEPEATAAHLLSTHPAADDRTVEALRRAARDAINRGAPETAARYLKRALEEPPAAAIMAEIMCELGQAMTRAGDSDGLPLQRRALAEAERQPQRAVAGLALGVALLRTGAAAEEAMSVFERALSDLHAPQLAISLEAMLLLAAITTPALRRRADDHLHQARLRASGRAPGRARLLLASLALDVLLSDGDAAAAAALAQRALAGGVLIGEEIETEMPLASPAALALILAGQPVAAERLLGEAVVQARERGALSVAARALAFRAFARYRIGQLAAAEADARGCLELAPAARQGIPDPLATATAAAVQLERADPQGARALIGQLDPRAYDPEVVPVQPLRETRAKLLAAERQPGAALEELRCCAEWEASWRARAGVAPVAWRSQAALASHALGDTATARTLAAQELEFARAFRAPGPIGVTLRALALIEQSGQRIELLGEAVDALERSERRLEHARALIDLGAALRRDGRRAAAIEKLRAGIDIAHRLTATALLARGREELELAGVRPARSVLTGQEALTPAERRAADLAAEGMRNKEIAQALFVTLRTIEMHLSSAYRKLGISSREQLPAALADE